MKYKISTSKHDYHTGNKELAVNFINKAKREHLALEIESHIFYDLFPNKKGTLHHILISQ